MMLFIIPSSIIDVQINNFIRIRATIKDCPYMIEIIYLKSLGIYEFYREDKVCRVAHYI